MCFLCQIAKYNNFFTGGFFMVVLNRANTNGVRMRNTVYQGFEYSYISKFIC